MGALLWKLNLLFLAGILFSLKHCASHRGCPLAATLSQNHRVLVLERGGSPYGNPNITNLSAYGVPLSDTSPSSPAQRFISEDGVINSRARVLGGGSCLNAGFYTRASPRYVREAGWDGKLVNESYKWVERVVAFRPSMRQWQSAVRDGLLEVGVLPYNGFTYDHIHGTKVGGTIFDHNGHRHTAADLLEYANTNTITLLLHATVHRILFTTHKERSNSRPVAHGVLYKDARGTEHRAYLNHGTKNEIIVSAGALGSPQLLMLSGIGAGHHLREHNISVVLDQPLVGQGMSDNPMNAVYVPSPSPVEVSLISVVGITNFGSYIEAVSGAAFTSNGSEFTMFTPKIGQFSKLPPKQMILQAIAKAIGRIESLDQEALRGGFILEKVIGPISTGHLELRNTDPNDNPLVTFNYFQDPRDLERCIQGMGTIEKIIDSNAFAPFRYNNISFSMLLNMIANAQVNLLPKHTNTSMSLEQFCRDTVMTIWHYHGGCQVGRVVDNDYKVLGVDALRVIDGSTFNYSPGTNPQATLMMLGRYMGVRILRERLAADETN
ncbi:protein HOTHEAD isoform X2 [Medicago truncatula]|uniref:protein HOTHEAD isoform X2 n=1 Tax=Medicago truncatula TaxID=3880 RepID=UPI00196784FA|nr:protein HOTHEAD isoform X2 [Medicago truncatula]